MSELVRLFPRYVIMYCLVSGFLLLALLFPVSPFSPLAVFGNQTSCINPFVQKTPTEALSSAVLIVLSASVLGFSTIFISSFITGNRSINSLIGRFNRWRRSDKKEVVQLLKRFINWVNRGLKWLKSSPQREENGKEGITPTSIYGLRWNLWVAKSGAGPYISLLNNTTAIINGLIVGSEVALIIDFFYLPICYILRLPIPNVWSPFSTGLPILSSWIPALTLCVLLGVSIVCLVVGLNFNKKFVIGFKKENAKMIKEYERWKRKTYPEENVPERNEDCLMIL